MPKFLKQTRSPAGYATRLKMNTTMTERVETTFTPTRRLASRSPVAICDAAREVARLHPLSAPLPANPTCDAGVARGAVELTPRVRSLALPIEQETKAEKIAFATLALAGAAAVVHGFGMVATLGANWANFTAWVARILA